MHKRITESKESHRQLVYLDRAEVRSVKNESVMYKFHGRGTYHKWKEVIVE